MNAYLSIVMTIVTLQLVHCAEEHYYTICADDSGSIKAVSPNFGRMHIINADDKCLLTDRLIKDYLEEAYKNDSFFLLGAYSCDESEKYTYVDGKTLLARKFRMNGPRQSIDPISKAEIKKTEFLECTYINDQLHIRGLGDILQGTTKGTILHNTAAYLLARDAELALKKNDLLEQKMQEYDCSSLPSVDMCLANGQMAYQMKDFHRASKWYGLVDCKDLSKDKVFSFSEGCLKVAIACGLKNPQIAIPLLEKVVALKVSDNLIGEAAGRLGQIYYEQNDIENKMKWTEISAKAGSIKSMCNLGSHYRKNDDIQKAIYWHHKVAQKGALPGMLNLFYDIAIEPKKHFIQDDALQDYANKLVRVLNKNHADDEQENYILHLFPRQCPGGYAAALEVIKKYTSVPILDELL